MEKEAKRKEKVDRWAIFFSTSFYFSRFVIKRYGKLIDNEKKVLASGKGSNTICLLCGIIEAS